jgi:hypothetical protein
MIRKIDVVISTNKDLLGLETLVDQIKNQHGEFEINIILIHQYEKVENLPKFLISANVLYKNLKEQNLSNAKNEGIKLSKSKIMTFIDDDVLISRDYFLTSWDFINKNDCDLMFCRINKINSDLPLSRNMKDKSKKINYFNSSCCLSSSMWINKKENKNLYFDKNIGLGAKFGSGDETDFIFSSLNLKKNIFYNAKVSMYHPEEFIGLNSPKDIYTKFFSYGMGQGALYKKHYNKSKFLCTYLYFVSLIKSILGIFLYLLFFRLKNIIKYFALFYGKILGFIKYKNNK